MKRRFIGNASSTPMSEMIVIHATICQPGITCPVTSMYAARLEMSGDTMYPAAVAIDCVQLFSRIVKSVARPVPAMIRYIANARITDVRPTPIVMPVFAAM